LVFLVSRNRIKPSLTISNNNILIVLSRLVATSNLPYYMSKTFAWLMIRSYHGCLVVYSRRNWLSMPRCWSFFFIIFLVFILWPNRTRIQNCVWGTNDGRYNDGCIVYILTPAERTETGRWLTSPRCILRRSRGWSLEIISPAIGGKRYYTMYIMQLCTRDCLKILHTISVLLFVFFYIEDAFRPTPAPNVER